MTSTWGRWPVLMLVLCLLATPTRAEETPPEIPEKGLCTVCSRRGSEHGVEKVADWRQYEGNLYLFCSEGCGEAFDQMPEGYAIPVLPRPAPPVQLLDLEGNPVALTGDRPTLVDFWATWCKPCLEMMPTLSALHAEGEVRVVGISIDEERGTLDRFLRKKAPDYPVVHDGGDDPAWWAFRVPAIPAAFLLDTEGRIIAQWGGAFSEDDLRQALADDPEAGE